MQALMPLILTLSMHHKIEVSLILAIIKVESNNGQALVGHNKNGTKDFGYMQVNEINLTKEESKFLQKNIDYGIIKGVSILADYKKRFPRTYVCRYNIGSAPILGKRIEKCKNYLKKIRRAIASQTK
jgi:soluble lytic murein transglycosylase-like protein